MRKLHVVTLPKLNCAMAAVKTELNKQGLWNARIAKVPVYLVLCGSCYGWQEYGSTGEIRIPMFSLCRLRDWYYRRYTSLRDVLRHEYGHAIAYCYPDLIVSKRFKSAFGLPHDSDKALDFEPGFHATEYSAKSPAEDFAELFMFYLARHGRLPNHLATRAIHRKWQFIRRLCRAVKTGARTL